MYDSQYKLLSRNQKWDVYTLYEQTLVKLGNGDISYNLGASNFMPPQLRVGGIEFYPRLSFGFRWVTQDNYLKFMHKLKNYKSQV